MADLEKTIHQLILKQFDIVGLKDPDIEKIYGEGNDEALTISFLQHQEWKEYCINVFEKAGYHPVLAENQFWAINIAYGLKVEDDE